MGNWLGIASSTTGIEIKDLLISICPVNREL